MVVSMPLFIILLLPTVLWNLGLDALGLYGDPKLDRTAFRLALAPREKGRLNPTRSYSVTLRIRGTAPVE